MPGHPDCSTCDFANRPETCHAVTARNKRYCQLIEAGRCDYRELVWDRTTKDARPFECPKEPAPTPPPRFIAPIPEQPPQDIPVEVAFAVVKCIVRGFPLPCGCQVEKRYCGNTLDLITYPDCIKCQQAQTNEAQP